MRNFVSTSLIIIIIEGLSLLRLSLTPSQMEAFQQIKHALTHAPVLTPPDFSKSFEVVSWEGVRLNRTLSFDISVVSGAAKDEYPWMNFRK